MGNGYYYRKRPKGVKSKYDVLVFDLKHQPFLPLTIFYDDQRGRLAINTLNSYLYSLLPFFSWFDRYSTYQGKRVKWNSESDAVRHSVETYLLDELGCKVIVKETYQTVEKTRKSPSSAHAFLSALKTFYTTMIRLKMYPYINPLRDAHAKLYEFLWEQEGEREGKPRMPAIAGTEEPLPQEHRRLTDSYFKLLNDEWVPIIIADRDLPYQVYIAGRSVDWSLREEVIARLLFDTGARASEIITMTIGDYRKRRNILEAAVTDKGSRRVRRKYIRFTDDTLILLKRYINTERKQLDPLGLTFDQLPDGAPIFLTHRKTAYTYSAWYPHWKKAMKKEGLSLNPHKARHWFVTNRMRIIYETSQAEGEVEKRMKQLVAYMAWRSKNKMLDVYQHFFDEEENRKFHDAFLESVKQREQEYLKERSSKRKRTQKKQVERIHVPASVMVDIQEDEDIVALFEELERNG